MRVRLVRKLAGCVDGIDLNHCTVGDVLDLAERQARLMIAERWAVFARRASDALAWNGAGEQTAPEAADGRRLRGDRRHSARSDDLYQRLRDKREQIEQERRRLRRRSTDAHSSAGTAA